MAGIKKLWNPSWRPRNGCDGRLMEQILIAIIQVNLVPNTSEAGRRQHKLIWIIAIKICAINLPSQPFLGCQLWFHNFFYAGQGRTFFTAWLFLSRFAYTSSNRAQFYSKAALETSENELDRKGFLSTYKKQNQLHKNYSSPCTCIHMWIKVLSICSYSI